MSKLSKICLIAAGGCFVFGIAAVCVGSSFGGRAALKDIYRSDFVLGGVPFWGGEYDEWSNYNVRDSWNDELSEDWAERNNAMFSDWDAGKGSSLSGDTAKRKVAEAGTIRELDVEAGTVNFYIKESEDDSYYFSSSAVGKVKCFTDGSKLVVKGVKKEVGQRYSTNDKMYLYIPASASLQDIEIKLGAGNVYSDALKADEISLKVGGGSFECSGLATGSLEAYVGGGNASIDNAVIRDCDVKLGAGQVDIEGEVSGNLESEGAAGNINLVLNGSEEDHNYFIKCALGTVKIGEKSYSGIASTTVRANEGANSDFDLKSAVGNIDISFKN